MYTAVYVWCVLVWNIYYYYLFQMICRERCRWRQTRKDPATHGNPAQTSPSTSYCLLVYNAKGSMWCVYIYMYMYMNMILYIF
jgi:hypothetical protein